MKAARKVSMSPAVAGLLVVAGVTLAGTMTFAQGCVAAHSNQRAIDGLVNLSAGRESINLNSTNTGGEVSSSWRHNLTVDIGYRVFNSNKYFQGSSEIPRSSAIRNHQNIFDVGIEYVVTPRWSLIA